ARTERSVGVKLYRADPEVAIVKSVLWPALDVGIPLRGGRPGLAGIAQHHVVPQIVISFPRQILEDADCLRILSRVVHSRESPPVGFSDGGESCSALVGARGGRNRARDQALRVIDENSGRGAGGGANDSSARGIRRRWDNARERDCSGI